MGNREKLLTAARRCLLTKGYGHSTARDIALEAGVSLAAIGYHFGSKDALLTAALIEATEAWGADLKKALASEDLDALEASARFREIWERILELFKSHRTLWAVSFEAISQADHSPELREFLASTQERSRAGLAALFSPRGYEAASGMFHHALLLGVMAQCVIDPDRAPTATALAEGLRHANPGVSRAELGRRDKVTTGKGRRKQAL